MKKCIVYFIIILSLFFLAGKSCQPVFAEGETRKIEVVQKWQGDYPVEQLGLLPEKSRELGVGYIGDAETFSVVWKAFKPKEEIPAVDFAKNIVVYSRNIKFYNSTSIAQVMLKDGGIEILAMETMSAMPIEDNVAMSLAVISKDGISFIKFGDKKISVD